MKQKLFTLAPALSLLLCLAAAVLWIQSSSSFRLSCWSRNGGNLYLLGATDGTFAFGVIGPWPCDERRWNTRSSPLALTTVRTSHEFLLGIQTVSTSGSVAVDNSGRAVWLPLPTTPNNPAVQLPVPTNRLTGRTLLAPSSLVVTITGLLPSFWLATFLWKRFHRRRSNTPLCVTCNYNLTANTTGICPECGTRIHPHPQP